MQRCSRQTDGTTVAGGVQTNAAMRPPVRMACGFLSNSGLDLRPAVTTEPDSQGDDLDCSQQNLFCTPDFLTPAEQCFAVEYDHNKENQGPRSPAPLSPDRYKKKRRWELTDEEDSQESRDKVGNTEIESSSVEEPLCTPTDAAPDSSQGGSLGGGSMRLPLFATPGAANQSSGRPPRRGGGGGGSKGAGKGGGGFSAPRLVLSPPCYSNPFLPDGPHARESLAQRRRGLLSAQQVAQPTSRFKADFQELGVLGSGSFGKVYKVVSRLDGCLYAVKKSLRPVRCAAERERRLQEVQALASLGSHKNIVQYFGAWIECDWLYVQMEMCESCLSSQQSTQRSFGEAQIKQLLREIGSALDHMHTRGLVHLDIKPENVFFTQGVYKLGDFGHATLLEAKQANVHVEEGDARYVARELLNHDHSNLDRADVFALGAMAYELARGTALAGNGVQYEEIRQGRLMLLPGFSASFQGLLKSMVHKEAVMRPTAASILKSSALAAA